MDVFTEEDKRSLLRLARSAVAAKLDRTEIVLQPVNPSPVLHKLRGCFVTLQKKGALRGCIGNLQPDAPLVENVEKNAVSAAFRDPRFPPLTESELGEVEFEISVLTKPQPLLFADASDLKRKLIPGVHGVILTRGFHSATFLPQVWDQLPEFETFLSHLCRKAGLGSNCWTDPEIEIQIYQVVHFSEQTLS
jgi:hypothetical protein